MFSKTHWYTRHVLYKHARTQTLAKIQTYFAPRVGHFYPGRSEAHTSGSRTVRRVSPGEARALLQGEVRSKKRYTTVFRPLR